MTPFAYDYQKYAEFYDYFKREIIGKNAPSKCDLPKTFASY